MKRTIAKKTRKRPALPGLGEKDEKTMLAMLSAFEAASNDKVLANSRLRWTPVHQEISSAPKPGRAKRPRWDSAPLNTMKMYRDVFRADAKQLGGKNLSTDDLAYAFGYWFFYRIV